MFSGAINHWIFADNIPSVARNKSMYGVITGIDASKKRLHAFFDDIGEEKVVPYNTDKLRWFEEMTSRKAKSVLRMLDNNEAL